MNLSLPFLVPHILTSLRDPRRFARDLFAMNLPREVCWRLLMLVSLLGVFVNHFGTLLTIDLDATPRDAMSAVVLMNAQMIVSNPFVHATTVLSLLVIVVYVTYWAGRWPGGTGAFPDAILTVAWVSFVWTALAALQLVIWIVSAQLAGLASLAIFILCLWLLTNFVAELHGFQSLVLVLAGIIASFIGVVIGLSFLFTLIGFNVPGL